MWQPAPARPALTHDTIHLWRVKLGAPPVNPILSPDEQERAARLKVDMARYRFISARTHLRLILARYLDTAPAGLTFTTNSHGKPYLRDYDLHFNLSHTEDLALLAVAMQPVGVDVERLRPVSNPDYIMHSAFTEREREVLSAMPADAALIAFWRCWTRKEAVMKLIGVGFRLAQQFSVSVDETPALTGTDALMAYHPTPPVLYNLLTPAPETSAALATYVDAALHCFDLA